MLLKGIAALAVSSLLGYLAGLGVGGGSLLMIWLTMAAGLEFPEAKTMNLLLFLPAAVISSLFHIKKGTLHLKKVFPIIISGVAGAVLASILSPYIKTRWLTKAFGVLLLITGVRELHFRDR